MLRGLLVRAARLSPEAALTGWRLRPRGLLTPGPRPSSSSSAGCWRCGAAPGPRSESEPPAFFCPACRALQPADPGLDYFRLLGLERRFRLDERRLRDSHRRLQWALHPDKFGGGCPAERRHSEEQSARVNAAFGALLRPVSRGWYLLRLELPGEAEEEEDEAAERPEADPAFLGAVLEFNERLEAARSPAEVQRVVEAAERRLRELGERVARAFERGRPREARPLLRRMMYWSSLAERARERLLPA